jgi:hypothetical protein
MWDTEYKRIENFTIPVDKSKTIRKIENENTKPLLIVELVWNSKTW